MTNLLNLSPNTTGSLGAAALSQLNQVISLKDVVVQFLSHLRYEWGICDRGHPWTVQPGVWSLGHMPWWSWCYSGIHLTLPSLGIGESPCLRSQSRITMKTRLCSLLLYEKRHCSWNVYQNRSRFCCVKTVIFVHLPSLTNSPRYVILGEYCWLFSTYCKT